MAHDPCPCCGAPVRREKVAGVWLTARKADIYHLIRTHPGITGPEIARRFHITPVSARSHIWQINEIFDIECVPLRLVGRSGPAGGYRLVDKRRKLASPEPLSKEVECRATAS